MVRPARVSIEELQRLQREGKSLREIARICKIDVMAVSRRLKAAPFSNLPVKQSRGKLELVSKVEVSIPYMEEHLSSRIETANKVLQGIKEELSFLDILRHDTKALYDNKQMEIADAHVALKMRLEITEKLAKLINLPPDQLANRTKLIKEAESDGQEDQAYRPPVVFNLPPRKD